ncbi:hypothetical protein SARC_14963 [Sphaeroforma arctica JP610]|uniref:Uncharacterized protein n=1 Tax=Sphaeroforma arctica JP610 TaxID=667725 RepID=A0A0L0F761_9EUKA|nr:hypothetical protein SARC_14963 [Sphaeroforma arctica JP610]KNC72479.1 hypothetical protein SARC_14963 [Sphaeroforma arctica JP610]|eukprot:XP_014146381.1 hypothetical protein SARC_14963 [Sphaeroforma arctica JP610]
MSEGVALHPFLLCPRLCIDHISHAVCGNLSQWSGQVCFFVGYPFEGSVVASIQINNIRTTSLLIYASDSIHRLRHCPFALPQVRHLLLVLFFYNQDGSRHTTTARKEAIVFSDRKS